MIEWIDIRPNDRILLLSIPEAPLIFELAAKVSSGVIVGLGGEDEVRAARRAARELENVMFVPAPLEEIPWQDGFFSKAIDLSCRWAQPERVAAELARVLGLGGAAYLPAASDAGDAMLAAGFRAVESGGPLSAFAR